MSDRINPDSLRANYIHRLQKLEERRALMGFSADPSIDMEIEHIRQCLDQLEAPAAPSTSQVTSNETGAASSQLYGSQNGSAPSTSGSSTTISAVFHGPVGNLHQGNGDINVYGNQQPTEIVPQWMIGQLRRGVRDYAPPDLAEDAQSCIHSLEDALRRHAAAEVEDALSWLQQYVPALDSQIHKLRRHLSRGTA